jgi:hypothetical protein
LVWIFDISKPKVVLIPEPKKFLSEIEALNMIPSQLPYPPPAEIVPVGVSLTFTRRLIFSAEIL